MKKLFIILLFIILNQLNCYAQQSTGIKFIYLNGSNSNTERKRQDFVNGIYNIQREIKKSFENNSCICSNFLKNGSYIIDEVPDVFFWGFESENDLNEADKLLQKTKKSSTFFASYFRDSIVHNIHDIIWIERAKNMQNTKNKLHQMVLKANYNGEKVVLAGHSAGAFITYVYILNKIKDFNTKSFLPNEDSKITCADAIIESEMGIKLNDGSVIINPDKTKMKKGYRELEFYTKTECVPEGLILGVMNFGSPLPLFYPDRLVESKDSAYIYQKNFFDYIKTHDLFFLTLNYKEDVLSLLPKNHFSKYEENSGFIYTYMNKKSPSTFINAHYTYWKHPKNYAQMAKDGYIEAYNQN